MCPMQINIAGYPVLKSRVALCLIPGPTGKMQPIVVWTFLTMKKREKIDYDRLVELASSSRVKIIFELVHPCCEEDMARMTARIVVSQERHVILHKISDYSKEELNNDIPLSLPTILDKINKLLEGLRNVRVINSMEAIGLVSDRWKTCQFFQSLPSEIKYPRTVIPCSLHAVRTLDFPVLWKPVSACGHPGSHDMFFITKDSLGQLQGVQDGITQEFVPHGGVLYKVFVVGSTVHVDIRPSIAEGDFGGKAGPQPFDSQFIRQLRPLDPRILEMANARLNCYSHLVCNVSTVIRERLGLELFGWDLIVSDAGHPYIIDVNNFPKFDGFPDFHKHLLDLITQ